MSAPLPDAPSPTTEETDVVPVDDVDVDEVEEYVPLHPRARVLFHLQALSWLFTFWLPVSAVGGSLIAWQVSVAWGGGLAVAWMFLMFIMAIWYPWLAFDRWGYLLRDEDLLITRGVLFHVVTAIPTNRIQHVDIRQGPIEQWMGLARLQIYTASSLGADGQIPGLEKPVAEALRDQLVRVEGDDGV